MSNHDAKTCENPDCSTCRSDPIAHEIRIQRILHAMAEGTKIPDFAKLHADIDEGDRQMILLALAELSIRRPGWELALRKISVQLQGEQMFTMFKKTSTGLDGKLLETRL